MIGTSSFWEITSVGPHIIGFLAALILASILTPLIRKWAIDAGKYDIPNDRKIHKYPIPRVGGIAIWLGFTVVIGIISFIYHGQMEGNALDGIILGGAIIFFIGLLDDLYNLSPYLKLFGQFLAAVVAFQLGVQVIALKLPQSHILLLQILSFPFTVLWIIGLSNALNFIDGVDGLAGGVTVISSLSFAVIAFNMDNPVPALLAIVLCGAALGFLNLNLHPARIFMGDSGALFCGFILACISVTGVLKLLTMTMLVPVIVLTVPILDITYSSLRRLWRFQSPFVADADHLHHKLLKAGLTQRWTVVALYSVCIIGGLITSYYVHHLREYILAFISVVACSVVMVSLTRFRTSRGNRRIELTHVKPDNAP